MRNASALTTATAYRATALGGASAVAALLILLVVTPVAAGSQLVDAGAVVRYGLVAATAIRDIAGALACGVAVLGATILPAANTKARVTERTLPAKAVARVRGIIMATSTTWVAASGLHLVLTYADVTGTPLTAPGFGDQLVFAFSSIPLFQYLTFALCVALLANVVAAGTRGPVGCAWVAGLGFLAWYSIALTGHAAGAGNHELAVSAWWLHIVGVSLWLGGLTVITALGDIVTGKNSAPLAAMIRRYSGIALIAALLTVVSGVSSAALRVQSVGDIATTYGVLVLVKAVATAVLVGAGYAHRRFLLRRLTSVANRLTVWRVVVGELVVFGAVMSVAAVLSRSIPPVPDTEVLDETLTPAQIVTGEELPPLPSLSTWFSQWQPDVLWIVLCVALAAAYARGVKVLASKGESWPWWRSVAWFLGVAAFAYLLNGAPAVYGRVLFSSHMLQHMLLSMCVPLLLVLGAPILLLLRATTARHDGSMGWREFTLAIVHAPYTRFFAHPVVAAINFTGSIIVFYFTPLFPLAISTHVGHVAMTVHFTLAGFLFAEVLVGEAPGIKRPAHHMRMMLLFVTMAFHAFFGVTLLGTKELLAATYFSSLGWGIDLMRDQVQGGGITWGVGEIPTLVLAALVGVRWMASDERDQRRADRDADRGDKSELAAYNAMLQGLSQADQNQPTQKP